MKEPSPLVPQGSFEAQARTKSRVKLAFYTIIAIHVLAIGGFLIIGCKRDDKDMATEPPMPTNDLAITPPIGTDPTVVSPAVADTNLPVAAVPTSPSPTVPVTIPPPAVPTTPTTVIAEPPPATLTEHTIVRGDNFSTLAVKYGVAVKDILAANPNLSPTRLQIGDKVKIPAKSATTAPTTAVTASEPGLYTVKSGDNLSKIATLHKTTVKELQRLNNLTTTQIRVGQKLKVPPAAATPNGGAPLPTGTPPAAQ